MKKQIRFTLLSFLMMTMLAFTVSCTSQSKDAPPIEEEVLMDSTVQLNDSLLESFLYLNDLEEAIAMSEAIVTYKVNEYNNIIDKNDALSDYQIKYLTDLHRDIDIMTTSYNETIAEYNNLKNNYNFGQYNQYLPEYYSELKYSLLE